MGLVDVAAHKDENLGFIRLHIKVSPVTEKELPMSQSEQQLVMEKKNIKNSNSKVWSSILTVTLLEGSNLPAMDLNGMFLSLTYLTPHGTCAGVGTNCERKSLKIMYAMFKKASKPSLLYKTSYECFPVHCYIMLVIFVLLCVFVLRAE